MNRTLRFRFAVFALAVGGLLALLALMAYHVSRRVVALGEESLAARMEALQAADELSEALLELNLALTHYAHTGDTGHREVFRTQSIVVWGRLADQKRKVLPIARDRLDALARAFSEFQIQAEGFVTTIESNPAADHRAAALARAEAGARHLIDLNREFARVQTQAGRRLLAEVQSDLTLLQRWAFGSIALLALLLGWTAWRVYCDMIAPLQARLVQSQAIIERQEKLSSLGTLAAGIAHEIRNPLTSIKARLFTQRKLLPAGTEALEDNRIIDGEISRLDRIVREFLLFARPGEPRLAVIDAAAPLKEVAELLRPELEKRQVALQLEIAAGPRIRGDADQLKQVLLNLVRNAAEALEGGGTVTLRCRTRAGRRRAGATQALLEVQDTGPGIPPEVQARLFDPFFTTKPQGTGLGLSIAARIIHQHGGAIEYQTQLNRGTTFRILLPVAAPDENPDANPGH